MAVMEGVKGIPGLFVASIQPDVLRLGMGVRFRALGLKRLEIPKEIESCTVEENFTIRFGADNSSATCSKFLRRSSSAHVD